MTRKDYETIAAALYERVTELSPRQRTRANALSEQHAALCHNVANALKADNPRFDRERFLAACGVDKDKMGG